MTQAMHRVPSRPTRGIALLIAVIFASIALSIGLSLAALASDQLSLSTTIKHSQIASHTADSVMECLHYEDKQTSDFAWDEIDGTMYISCLGVPRINLSHPSAPEGKYLSSNTYFQGQPFPWFDVPNGGCAKFTVQKIIVAVDGDGNPLVYRTKIYVTGANTCDFSKPEQRVERSTYLEYTN